MYFVRKNISISHLLSAALVLSLSASLLYCSEDTNTVPSGGDGKDKDASPADKTPFDDDDDDDGNCFCGGSCESCSDNFDCPSGEKCIDGFCDYPGCSGDDDDDADDDDDDDYYDPTLDEGDCTIAKGIDCDCIQDADCLVPLSCTGGLCTNDCEPGTYKCWCNAQNPCKDPALICVKGICREPTCDPETSCEPGFCCDEKAGICVPCGGTIEAAPAVMDFGAVAFHSSTTKEVALQNKGSVDIKIFQVEFDRSTNKSLFQFVSKPQNNSVIPPGGSLKIQVAYTPDDGEEDVGSIVVTNDSGNAPSLDIPMVMQFKGNPDFRLIDYATNTDYAELNGGNYEDLAIDFGDLPEGGARTLVMWIKNGGDGNKPLTLSQFEMALTGTPFAIDLKDSTAQENPVTLPFHIIPGTWIQGYMSVACPPSQTGLILNEKVSIRVKGDLSAAYHHGDPNAKLDDGKLTINYLARCGYVPPAIEVSKTLVDLGEAHLIKNPSIKPRCEDLKVRNVGGADLMIEAAKSGLLLPDTPFTIENLANAIPPGGTIGVAVCYQPTSVTDPSQNTLRLISNDPTNGQVDVKLVADPADPELLIDDRDEPPYGSGTKSDGKIEFGSVDLNNRATVDVYVKNSGLKGTLIISSLKIIGANVFEIDPSTMPTMPLNLTAGNEHLLKVDFLPVATNAYSAQLEFKTNDLDLPEGDKVVDITGTGDLNVGNDSMIVVLTNSRDQGGKCTFGGGTDKRDVDLKISLPNGTCPSYSDPRCTISLTAGRDEANITMSTFSTAGDGQYSLTAQYMNDCVETGLFCNCDSKSVSGTVTVTVSPNPNDPNGVSWQKSYPYSLGGAGQTTAIANIRRENGRFKQP